MKKNIIIIFNENCLKNFKKLIKYKINKIFFLTPLLEHKFNEIYNFKYKKIIHNIDYSVKKKIINNSIDTINKLQDEIYFFKKNFIHFKSIYHYLYLTLNSVQYFNALIPDSDNYIYYNKKWIFEDKKEKIIFFITEFYIKNKIGVFKVAKNEKIKFKFIIRLYNYLLLKKIKNKKKFFIYCKKLWFY